MGKDHWFGNKAEKDLIKRIFLSDYLENRENGSSYKVRRAINNQVSKTAGNSWKAFEGDEDPFVSVLEHAQRFGGSDGSPRYVLVKNSNRVTDSWKKHGYDQGQAKNTESEDVELDESVKALRW
jgi:hypothetical protein